MPEYLRKEKLMKVLPNSIDNAISNISGPLTKNIGQTFGDIWSLVFGEISHKANKARMRYAMDLEKYQNELLDAINKIPDNKRIEPSIQITAQALENSKYCISSKQLREMFVNLISGTMNSDLEPRIHPSFPEILKQLSKNDALMLQLLKQRHDLPIANIGVRTDECKQTILYTNVCPFIPGDSSVDKCSVSISSLIRAGIAYTSFSRFLDDETAYDLITINPEYNAALEICKHTNQTIYFQKGLCGLTDLGSDFIYSCVS